MHLIVEVTGIEMDVAGEVEAGYPGDAAIFHGLAIISIDLDELRECAADFTITETITAVSLSDEDRCRAESNDGGVQAGEPAAEGCELASMGVAISGKHRQMLR